MIKTLPLLDAVLGDMLSFKFGYGVVSNQNKLTNFEENFQAFILFKKGST